MMSISFKLSERYRWMLILKVGVWNFKCQKNNNPVSRERNWVISRIRELANF